jgi:hypothetical protein
MFRSQIEESFNKIKDFFRKGTVLILGNFTSACKFNKVVPSQFSFAE